MLEYLRSKRFANARGIDISEEQIALAQKQGLHAEVADVFEFLESSQGTYDAIIAIDFVEHFTKPELLRLFQLVRKALAPNGRFLIQTANGEGLFPRQIIYGDLTHMTIFTPGSIAQLLRATGFSHIEFSEAAPLASGLRGMLRSFLWNTIRFCANFVRKIEAGKSQAVWTENFITLAR
jgi:cyclopropane fatty-acyl-phospholipid synthase-like methyltransferase